MTESNYTEMIQVEGLGDDMIGQRIGPFQIVSFNCLDNKEIYDFLRKNNVRSYVRKIMNGRQLPQIICLTRTIFAEQSELNNVLKFDCNVLAIVLHILSVKINDSKIISAMAFEGDILKEYNNWGLVILPCTFRYSEYPLNNSEILINNDAIEAIYQSVYGIMYYSNESNKKYRLLWMYISSLYIDAWYPKFISMLSILDMIRDGDNHRNVTKRVATVTSKLLSELGTKEVYEDVINLYSARSEYIHQGINININDKNIIKTNDFCVRIIWKILSTDLDIEALESKCTKRRKPFKKCWE